jgi:NADPH:quinone reductase-like Zn-dependent oxidoreductase
MKAIYFQNHGGLDQIQYGDLPEPIAKPNEILIETEYTALNHLDLFVLQGWPGLKLTLPHIMGSDGAGIVKEIGANVTDVKIGDRVVINPGLSCGKCVFCLRGEQNYCSQFGIKGETTTGTFAEYFTIPEINAYKVPDSFGLDKAAAASLTFLTAWRMLVTQAKIKPGDRILIQGAGGGVATAAIQIAKYFGAKVIATTGTMEKVEKTKILGADFVFNYRDDPKYGSTIFKEITQKQGVDIVVDSVGAPTFSDSIRLIKTGGKFVTCGATAGGKVELDLRAVFWKQLHIIGSTMATQGEFRAVMDRIVEGKFGPIIDKVFPLAEGQTAENYLSKSTQFGKIILKNS